MRIPSMSASRIKTWRQCRFKYYMNYVLKLDMGTNWGAQHGTAIHHVLERYANGERDWRKLLLKAYQEIDSRRNTYILQHAKAVDYDKVKKKCSTCPHNNNGVCLLEQKSAIDLPGCGRLLYGRSELLLENYFDQYDDIYDKEQIGVEYEFKLNLGDHRNTLGFMDYIYRTTDGMIHMIDYKSSKKYEATQNHDAVKKDIQAKMYAWALNELYPGETTMLTFHYFMNRPITVFYNSAEIESIRQELIETWDQIEKFEEQNLTRLIDTHGGKWAPNECKYLCDQELCRNEWGKFKNGQY